MSCLWKEENNGAHLLGLVRSEKDCAHCVCLAQGKPSAIVSYPGLNIIPGALVRNSGSVGKPYVVTFGGIAYSGWIPAKTIKDPWLLSLSQSRIWHGILSRFWGIRLSASPFPQKSVLELRGEVDIVSSSAGFRIPGPSFPFLWFLIHNITAQWDFYI